MKMKILEDKLTMRRPKKAKETLALSHKIPWEGRQAIRSARNPNAIVKILACGAKSKKRKKINKRRIKEKKKTLGRLKNLTKQLKEGYK